MELEFVRQSGWHRFPPRLPEQPIFYPILDEAYAIEIARDWNAKYLGTGFVRYFDVESEFLNGFTPWQVARIDANTGFLPSNWRNSTTISLARSEFSTCSLEKTNHEIQNRICEQL